MFVVFRNRDLRVYVERLDLEALRERDRDFELALPGAVVSGSRYSWLCSWKFKFSLRFRELVRLFRIAEAN